MSKLTAPQVQCIRSFCGIWRQRSIARHFGISQHTVMAVRRGLVWKHLTLAAPILPTTIRSHPRGETNACAKLTADNVREIRALAGSISNRESARRFGVSCSLIGAILLGKRWKHVE